MQVLTFDWVQLQLLARLSPAERVLSAKHPADIQAMLVFALSGLGTETIDLGAITVEAARLGSEVAALWKSLVKHAENQVQGRQGT